MKAQLNRFQDIGVSTFQSNPNAITAICRSAKKKILSYFKPISILVRIMKRILSKVFETVILIGYFDEEMM